MNSLQELVGQVFQRLERIHDYVQVYFSDYTLNIYNDLKWTSGPDESKVVVAVREDRECVEMVFSDASLLRIDLRPEAWRGPEALGLYRGRDCIMVWT